MYSFATFLVLCPRPSFFIIFNSFTTFFVDFQIRKQFRSKMSRLSSDLAHMNLLKRVVLLFNFSQQPPSMMDWLARMARHCNMNFGAPQTMTMIFLFTTTIKQSTELKSIVASYFVTRLLTGQYSFFHLPLLSTAVIVSYHIHIHISYHYGKSSISTSSIGTNL